MILSALAATGALLAGVGYTAGVGEDSPAPQLSARVAGRLLRVEGDLDLAHKHETGDGWQADVAADVGTGLVVGGRWSYRHTSLWSKDGPWARIGYRRGPLALLVEASPGRNRERKAELRYVGRVGAVVVETRGFIELHAQGTGGGVSVLLGVGH